ncbi:sigma-70 family RNA polymerase sigma factor [Bacillus ndiopicus]|uniref:sigma-70 family RNA polymerase sigma factor n=1 Tax=Bacillus ndiopicus TaxID=1347368 RepID=UPI0012B5CAF0|nr:sigma-70 family RNA polymerase sigma factor [Bacillus ndiopicus]
MENESFLKNKLITSFLKNSTNKNAYELAINNPTLENQQQLDKLFKAFYFDIRFISHISSTIHFNAINYDKRTRTQNSRYNLTLDSSIDKNDNDNSFINLLIDEESKISLDKLLSHESILKQVSCPILYASLKKLTKKQLKIIELAYVNGLSDTEIGKLLNISQQSISKTHKKALKELASFFIENKGGKSVD